tara:strand:+ start:1400 stop:1609 length:210 start_codon:yes stop_codon:yes gene_type:complete
MFIELTEIVMDGLTTYGGKPKLRLISVNLQKIQAFHPEVSTNHTVIQLKGENLKVKESYKEVKDAIQKN